MGNKKTNSKPACFLHFPTSTSLLHCRHLYLLLGSPRQCRVRNGYTSSLPLLPPHTFSLLRCRSSPRVRSSGKKSAAVQVFHGTKFLQEIPLCSGMRSSVGCDVDMFSALELLPFLFWPWPPLCFFLLFVPPSSLPGEFFARKYIFGEVPHTWWKSSAVSCTGSVSELARTTCV